MLKSAIKNILKAVLVLTLLLSPLYINDAHERYLLTSIGNNVFIISNKALDVGGGTGFILNLDDNSQVMITNKHVCEAVIERLQEQGKAPILWAHQDNGDKYKLKIIKISRKHDMCALTAPEGFSGLNVSSERDLFDKIYIVGHPLLRPLVVSSGRIIGREGIQIFEKEVSDPNDCDRGDEVAFNGMSYGCIKTQDAMETTATAMPGNSGSPIVDFSGNVVGILFAGDNQMHFGDYVPLEYLKVFMLELSAKK